MERNVNVKHFNNMLSTLCILRLELSFHRDSNYSGEISKKEMIKIFSGQLSGYLFHIHDL